MTRRDVMVMAVVVATAAFMPLWSISQQVSLDEDRNGALLQFEFFELGGLQTPDGRWLLVVDANVPADPRVAEYPRIAIIDSGIAVDHPQVLASAIVAQRDFTGEGIRDVLGHGTIVAILTTSGVATVVEAAGGSNRGNVVPLLIAKVARQDGTVSYAAVLEAIQWAIAEGATHVNLSLGFDERSGDYSELCALIDNYSDSDVVFVAAAGNSGPAVRFFPASCEGVVCVSSGDDTSGPCGDGGISAPVNFELRPTGEGTLR